MVVVGALLGDDAANAPPGSLQKILHLLA
jgi:hypothetical protein